MSRIEGENPAKSRSKHGVFFCYLPNELLVGGFYEGIESGCRILLHRGSIPSDWSGRGHDMVLRARRLEDAAHRGRRCFARRRSSS